MGGNKGADEKEADDVTESRASAEARHEAKKAFGSRKQGMRRDQARIKPMILARQIPAY